ncbi:MAG: spermidine/putrescine ABC transporter substrate-binding protein [Richelia sp.]|nr:spermidine/putrescine ABC transporter substrate-binding protein [Richelia sp.]
MVNRRIFLEGLAAFSSFTLSSCGWKLADVKTTATRQGSRERLDIYTWSQYSEKKLINTFTTQTGIKVVVDVYDSNEFMLAKLRAGGGGSYSILYPSDYMVQKMVGLGLLTQISHQSIRGLDNLFSQFNNPKYDPNNEYSIPFSWGTTGFIYNSELLKTPPDDWDYLWRNKDILNKRMTLLNDIREVMGGVLKMLGYDYNSQDENAVKQAYEKLKELKDAIASFHTDAWRNQILTGDLLLAMCYSGDAVAVTKENPKLKYVVPKSGSSLWTDTIVIPTTSPNTDAAYAWINFMLQPEVGAKMSVRLGMATTNQTGFELLPKRVKNNTILFPPQSTIDKCDRITPLGEIEAVYERYWTELTSS